MIFNRRFAITAALAAPLAAPWIARAQGRQRVKVLLNTGLSGPQSFLFLAADALAGEGIVLEFSPGSGANNTAPRMIPEGYDVGFGDVNALADMVARGVAHTPLAVFNVFPASPNAVAVKASGPVLSPKDLAGRTVISHPTDTALHTFPAYARAAGIDPASVKIIRSSESMGDFVKQVIAGSYDGAFGWANTLRYSARLAQVSINGISFLRFRDLLPDLHGGFIMVSPAFAAANPSIVRALLAAAREGIAKAKADPDAAMAALAKRLPGVDLAAHRERMLGTFQFEMDHPDVAKVGVGKVDSARFARSMTQLSAALNWPRTPSVNDIYSARYITG